MLTYTFDDISSTPYAKLSVFSYTNILHRHTFFEITLILRGTAASVINSQQAKQLSAGDLILLRPCDCHSIQPQTKDYEHLDIYISEEKMRRICATISDGFYEEIMAPDMELNHRFSQIETSLIEKKTAVFTRNAGAPDAAPLLDSIHTSIIMQILGEIMVQRLPASSSIPLWLSNLYLHLSSFHYVSYSVDEIVKTTGYSHSYVCQMFKKTYNTTLQDCLIRSKVIISAEMLGKEKIIDIAAAFGWENPKNYTLAFKKVFGVTPKAYRSRTADRANEAGLFYTDPPKMEHMKDFEKIIEPNEE